MREDYGRVQRVVPNTNHKIEAANAAGITPSMEAVLGGLKEFDVDIVGITHRSKLAPCAGALPSL